MPADEKTGKQANMTDRTLIGELLGEIVSEAKTGRRDICRIGLMSIGSEHVRGGDAGQGELLEGAARAMRENAGLEVVMIGPRQVETNDFAWIESGACESDIASTLDKALAEGSISGAVALHYPFPLGVATIGRVVTPLRGREMLIASTTGTTATDRVEAMTRNAIYGIATAKALGIADPSLGILNVDGASTVKRILDRLRESGYHVRFGESIRKDGGSVLRGNDLLAGAVDVCVTDTLTGNVLMKLFSSWNNGGLYETTGYGYGPSVGQSWKNLVSIISRASGAPVIANALLYTAQVARADLRAKIAQEYERAERAGLEELLAASVQSKPTPKSSVARPPAEPTDEEIHGVDVLSIDDATNALLDAGIYAEASMGCTGPVVKVPAKMLEKAKEALATQGYL